jgi:hypothetical protein
MPADNNLILQASVTKTATFNGAALTFPSGTPRAYNRLYARVIYSAATNASGSNSVVFSVDVSTDGGTNYTAAFQAPAIALSTTAQASELYIPFEAAYTSLANGVKVRLSATFSGAGSTPTITYQGDIVPSMP